MHRMSKTMYNLTIRQINYLGLFAAVTYYKKRKALSLSEMIKIKSYYSLK